MAGRIEFLNSSLYSDLSPLRTYIGKKTKKLIVYPKRLFIYAEGELSTVNGKEAMRALHSF
jgi:hypothetical protein